VEDYLQRLFQRWAGARFEFCSNPAVRRRNTGLLLTRIDISSTRRKEFLVADAAMNDLLRPALYDAWHEVLPLHAQRAAQQLRHRGAVCESADFLARERTLAVRSRDLLAIMSAAPTHDDELELQFPAAFPPR